MEPVIDLVVLDDETKILNALERLMEDEPFEAQFFSDPEEAMACIKAHKVKVVMSDQMMPHVCGIEFLRSVKEENPDILRILFTGYADMQAAEDAINKGEVYRFINKPWDDDVLIRTLYDAIERFDLLEKNRQLGEDLKKQNQELIVLNTKLQNMYEAQKAFTSTVSHELRTPLAAIKIAVDIIVSETTGPLNENQKSFLQKAKISIDRLGGLIDDILDLTKLESGKTTLDVKQNDLHELIYEIVDIQKIVAVEKGLELASQLDEGVPEIPFDRNKITQVFTNLINNAIKFTDSGNIIVTTQCHSQENHVQVSVRDTGVGIREEDIPKMFQKFQQLGAPEERTSGGTGLGLAICREIIHQHGGKIWVESVYGEGTTFHFLLPICERRKA